MNVILDTNIWVSFLFGKQLQSVRSLFTNKDVHVYVSYDLIKELLDVTSRPKIKQHISQDAVVAMWDLMKEKCYVVDNYPTISAPVRDPKDVYLLAMADAIPADVIVTGDKDLLALTTFKETEIITFAEFQLLLSARKE